MAPKRLAMLAYFLQLLALSSSHPNPKVCKAQPGTKAWPSEAKWESLDNSLSGQLIKTIPPGAVCHPSQPSYDGAACPAVQAGWKLAKWHTENPVSVIMDNFANDTCLPDPKYPCSGEGYPIYVVNATTAEHVKKGVDFARQNKVRLVVKGTGHDYLGRSAAPNSLSVWTHNINGLEFFDVNEFTPKRCRVPIDKHVITIGAGTQMLEIDEQASLRNLTIVGGGAGSVGIGGYLTGGGHSAISLTFGLAADQVVEMEVVTASGNVVTANACQNEDLFWAMRGGGGSTFGVMTSATIKAYPSFKFATVSAMFGAPVSSSDAYYDALTTVFEESPDLGDLGISAYYFDAANVSGADYGVPVPGMISGFIGTFMLPLIDSANTSDSLLTAVNAVVAKAIKGNEDQFLTSVTEKTFDDFWAYYKDNNGPSTAGGDGILGSRLLDRKSLTGNRTALKEALIVAPGKGILLGHLVSGKGVHNAKIPGGSNAVNPAWRSAYVHTVVSSGWDPLDAAGREKQLDLNTNVYTEALRKIAPDTGAYINEADLYEPSFQKTFWGANYPRLWLIKKILDPLDVFWCSPCVGNEGWEVVDDALCRKW
ncbi:hypothetical protein V502_06248 [Pseudogymnoascus sp. VKM F-4520 (FW-2644)]|nr:hypothetical protein V502_06248 [Pseudogymnoascus sp. VKM F-4520 (FW-2644)]